MSQFQPVVFGFVGLPDGDRVRAVFVLVDECWQVVGKTDSQNRCDDERRRDRAAPGAVNDPGVDSRERVCGAREERIVGPR